ncbi:MAG: serine/threonine-protein kinase [Caldimonas sp.]
MTSAPDFEETRAVPQSTGDVTLPVGVRLRDYEVTGVIAEGAFGIVYLGWDHALHRKVAIEEYLPASIATRADDSAAVVTPHRQLDTFKAGLASFVNEARLLAGLDHPSLLKVYRYWEENGTAYRAMPFHEGPNLRAAHVALGHVPSEAELRIWVKPILDAMTVLHTGGIWHQNIGPEAILITATGPVLLGFASAAHAIESIHHTPAKALRPGFAAIEQYGSEAGTTRGPWTDLYALAATVYSAVTGADPAPAADRLAHDHVRPLSVVAAGLYSPGFLAAIDAAMAIQPQQRPADHAEFRALMGDIEASATVVLAPRRDLMQELFLPLPDESREVTVPDPPRVAATEPAPAGPAPAAAPVAGPPRPPRPPRAAPAAAAPAATGTDRSLPSWMSGGTSPVAGKRVLYGVIAGTCALIGIAALTLQFATRSASLMPLAASAPPVAVPAAKTAPAVVVAPPVAASASSLAPIASPTPAPIVTAAPVPTPAAAIVATPAPAPAPAIAPAAPPVPATRTAAASAPPAAPTDPNQRQSRCIDILQKASLEKITVAETEYFKKECK